MIVKTKQDKKKCRFSQTDIKNYIKTTKKDMQQTYIFTNRCLEILNYELTFFTLAKLLL